MRGFAVARLVPCGRGAFLGIATDGFASTSERCVQRAGRGGRRKRVGGLIRVSLHPAHVVRNVSLRAAFDVLMLSGYFRNPIAEESAAGQRAERRSVDDGGRSVGNRFGVRDVQIEPSVPERPMRLRDL